jgi:gliding motility-associated-like protein
VRNILRSTIFISLFLTRVITYGQTANFTASTVSGCSPLVVNFQDQSTGNPATWYWNFGNGATANLQNPSTTYFTPGTYTVTLTVTNAQGSNTLTRTQYITVYGKPGINFTVNDSTACFPHHAQFTDLSTVSTGTNNTSWFWDFGDGSQGSSQNPQHTYTASGNYTVNLKVTNDKGCWSVLTKPAYIVINGGVQAGFTNTQPTVCRPPFAISFSGTATGPGALSYYWDFGDGNTSALQNPVHNYTTPGNYTVSFATTSSGGCSDTIRKVSVLNIENITTGFTAPDSVCINSTANFQNTGTPAPASANWLFGDATGSTAISPSKAYSAPGTYTVKLYNTYSYCTDSAIKTIKVLPRPVARFYVSDSFKCQPNLLVNFNDLSSNAVSWAWDFGDGGTSNQQNPSHTYTAFGTYAVRLIVTNASGCTDTLIKPNYIKIIKPVITFPGFPIEGCIPYALSPVASIVTLDNVTSWFWDFGDGFTSASPNPSHTYTSQGTYTLSLTITTSTGCTETYAMGSAVKVGRHPIVNFSGAPNPVCAFQPVQFTDLTNEADKWLWIFGDGSTSILKNPLYMYSDTGQFSVQLIATNNGCKDSLKITNYITVKPPIARFGFQTNCTNRFQFNFLDSSIGATSWFWNFGDGTTSTQQNPIHFFPSYNSYTVTLTVSNDTCSHSLTKIIKVLNEMPDFHSSAVTACKPAGIYFFGDVADLSNITNYLWDFGDGTQWNSTAHNSGNNANNYYTASGYYTVSLITTDIYGCKDTTIKPNYIRINGPVSNFTAANRSGCKGLITTFSDQSTNDGISNIVSWKWNFGDGQTQTLGSAGPFQHTYVNPGVYTVKLIVTDAGGCMDSITRQDYIIASDPKANFSSADTLACPGSVVTFSNSSIAFNYTSSWTFGDGNTSAITSPTNSYATTGLYTVKLVITDQFGCSDSMTRPNYIKVSKPVAGFTVSDSISSCTPLEVDFTNTSQYYIASFWNLGGGTSTITNPVQFYNSPGVYPVKLIVTSNGGCKDSIVKTITVFDTTGSKVTYLPLDGCKPLLVNLATFSPGPMSYTWDFGDGVLINNNSTTINHVYNFFGNFVPKVIMKDPAGCIIPITGLDTIRIKGATVKFGLDKKLFCDSGLVTFSDSTIYNDSLSFYHWNFGDGTSSALQNPTHYYTTSGTYSVYLNVQTQNACVDTFRYNFIKVVQSPLISVAGDSVICINDFMQHLGVFDRPDTSAVQWSWQFPNSNTSGIQIPVLQQYKTAGNFVVTTIATNSSGCKDTAIKNIRINPLPVVTMPSTITMQAGFPVTIPATYSSNVATYNWIPPATLSCADCPQPTASPKFNTKYTVSFVDSNGCKNTGEVQVIVICKNVNVFVPNTFSPNGDGTNDVFYVRGKGLNRVKSIRIFNRWGEVVFEQTNFPVNDPLYGWNGKVKGNKAQPDVYVYQVEVFCDNSQIIHFEGNVALIE